DWVGASTHGVCTSGVEYQDEPAIAVMLCGFPENGFRVFSGRARLASARAARSGFEAALVHADPATPDLAEMLGELALLTQQSRLFGGIVGGESGPALQLAGGIVAGGVSGAAFAAPTMLRSRVTQGCSPLGNEHRIS